MSERELDAAGITVPELRRAYAHCKRLNARHGKTYFLATRLLPVERRPAVHALYGFARWADDIVDAFDDTTATDARSSRLSRLQRDLATGLDNGDSSEPVVVALADTARRYAIEHRHFTDFMTAMRADLDITGYATYADLRTYTYGSAEVIGLQMLPVLGTAVPREEAAPYAAALGVAFQLTNFLRDVGEDLDRGRVYLPADLLAAHGVDRRLLRWSRNTGRSDGRITDALREFEALTRELYRAAAPGIALLDPVSRPCIRTAFVLYGAILDAVAQEGYRSVQGRAVVSRRRRAAVALDGLTRVSAARLRARTAGRRTAPGPTASAGSPPPPEIRSVHEGVV
ncbi:phytoene/squalene synthase family protein [Streptomyces sp. NPDC005374]|uniref:phytoene/squalene synthase family protein n=1 Tax=Streptomyces sp. NPDC005374 TaxID=3364713 RepID=UPI0036B7591F